MSEDYDSILYKINDKYYVNVKSHEVYRIFDSYSCGSIVYEESLEQVSSEEELNELTTFG